MWRKHCHFVVTASELWCTFRLKLFVSNTSTFSYASSHHLREYLKTRSLLLPANIFNTCVAVEFKLSSLVVAVGTRSPSIANTSQFLQLKTFSVIPNTSCSMVGDSRKQCRKGFTIKESHALIASAASSRFLTNPTKQSVLEQLKAFFRSSNMVI